MISRTRYQEIWRDPMVTIAQVLVREGTDASAVAEQINARFATSHTLRAFTAEQFKGLFSEAIDAAFAGTYALIFVGFSVSFIAVVNFLLAMLVERRVWYQRLHTLSANASQIRSTVLTEGGVLGIIGSLVGIAGAAGTSLFAIYRGIPIVNGWRFEYTFPFGPVFFGLAGTIVLAVAAAGIPARLATRARYLLESVEE